MPQPQQLDELTEPLVVTYGKAWDRILAEQESLAKDPLKFRRRARLAELAARVEQIIFEADDEGAEWVAKQYGKGYALGVADGAAATGSYPAWTMIHQTAVENMGEALFRDLLAATKNVNESTKELIRSVARDEALQAAIGGGNPQSAAREMRRVLAKKGIHAVVYADGSKHGLAEYSKMSIRTSTAIAYNTGSINHATAVGTHVWEVFDGPDCGWSSHDDTTPANGRLVTRDEALGQPIAHPNCRRAFGPRPDKKVEDLKKPGEKSLDNVFDGTGTPDDPILCHGDLDVAIRALGQGKSIRLQSSEEAGTLLTKLNAVVQDAIKRGDEAPLYDLCKVSVPGTNLFCQEALGIPRIDMPQLGGIPLPNTPAALLIDAKNGEADLVPGFLEHLQTVGFKVEAKKIPASHLKATQAQLKGNKVAGMIANENFTPNAKAIIVTRDGYIVDGHHRWAATVGTELTSSERLMMPVHQVDMDIGEMLERANLYAAQMGIPPADAAGVSAATKYAAKKAAAESAGLPSPKVPTVRVRLGGRTVTVGESTTATRLEQRSARLRLHPDNLPSSAPPSAKANYVVNGVDYGKDVKTVEELVAAGWDPAKAVKEFKRLKANASSKASKARAKLKAAGKSVTPTPAQVDATLDALEQQINSVWDDLIEADLKRAAGDPAILYTPAAGQAAGAGAYAGDAAGSSWAKLLDREFKNGEYIPVHNLQINGVTIQQGLATRRNGISYLFEVPAGQEITPDIEKAFEAAIWRAHQAMEPFPDSVLNEMNGFAFLRVANPEDAHWAAEYKMPGFKSAATASRERGIITFWDSKPRIATLQHELGHMVDGPGRTYTKGSLPDSVFGGKDVIGGWAAAQHVDQSYAAGLPGFIEGVPTGDLTKKVRIGQIGVSDYGGTAVDEDFAESIRLYLRDQHDLQLGKTAEGTVVRFADLFPERARILDEIFGKQSAGLVTPLVSSRVELTLAKALEKNVHSVEDFRKLVYVPRGKHIDKHIDDVLGKAWSKKQAEVAAAEAAAKAQQAELGAKQAKLKKFLTGEEIKPKIQVELPPLPKSKAELPKNVKASIASSKTGHKKKLTGTSAYKARRQQLIKEAQDEWVKKGHAIDDPHAPWLQPKSNYRYKSFYQQIDNTLDKEFNITAQLKEFEAKKVKERIEQLMLERQTKALELVAHETRAWDPELVEILQALLKNGDLRSPSDLSTLLGGKITRENLLDLWHDLGGSGGPIANSATIGRNDPAANALAARFLSKPRGDPKKAVGGHTLSGPSQKAKATIDEALAERLADNEAAWEAFRASKADSTGASPIRAFNSYTHAERVEKLRPETAQRISVWASTSGDEHPQAVAMQMAIKDEFGTAGDPAVRIVSASKRAAIEKTYQEVGEWYRYVARAMYDNTQSAFREEGITHIAVFRGMHKKAWTPVTVGSLAPGSGLPPAAAVGAVAEGGTSYGSLAGAEKIVSELTEKSESYLKMFNEVNSNVYTQGSGLPGNKLMQALRQQLEAIPGVDKSDVDMFMTQLKLQIDDAKPGGESGFGMFEFQTSLSTVIQSAGQELDSLSKALALKTPYGSEKGAPKIVAELLSNKKKIEQELDAITTKFQVTTGTAQYKKFLRERLTSLEGVTKADALVFVDRVEDQLDLIDGPITPAQFKQVLADVAAKGEDYLKGSGKFLPPLVAPSKLAKELALETILPAAITKTGSSQLAEYAIGTWAGEISKLYKPGSAEYTFMMKAAEQALDVADGSADDFFAVLEKSLQGKALAAPKTKKLSTELADALVEVLTDDIADYDASEIVEALATKFKNEPVWKKALPQIKLATNQLDDPGDAVDEIKAILKSVEDGVAVPVPKLAGAPTDKAILGVLVDPAAGSLSKELAEELNEIAASADVGDAFKKGTKLVANKLKAAGISDDQVEAVVTSIYDSNGPQNIGGLKVALVEVIEGIPTAGAAATTTIADPVIDAAQSVLAAVKFKAGGDAKAGNNAIKAAINSAVKKGEITQDQSAELQKVLKGIIKELDPWKGNKGGFNVTGQDVLDHFADFAKPVTGGVAPAKVVELVSDYKTPVTTSAVEANALEGLTEIKKLKSTSTAYEAQDDWLGWMGIELDILDDPVEQALAEVSKNVVEKLGPNGTGKQFKTALETELKKLIDAEVGAAKPTWTEPVPLKFADEVSLGAGGLVDDLEDIIINGDDVGMNSVDDVLDNFLALAEEALAPEEFQFAAKVANFTKKVGVGNGPATTSAAIVDQLKWNFNHLEQLAESAIGAELNIVKELATPPVGLVDDYGVAAAAAAPGAVTFTEETLAAAQAAAAGLGKLVEAHLQPANSWSTSKSVARRFGSNLLYAVVPVERVLGSARTGFGCLSEKEFVILQSVGTAIELA